MWFPLVLFGALVMGSGAVCSNGPPSTGGRLSIVAIGLASTDANTLYWLIASPIAYLAVYGFYQWRERHRGVGEEIRPYLAVGLTLALLSAGLFLLLLTPISSPVVTAVGLGVAVIAWMLHRPLVAVLIGALAILALVNAFVPILFYGHELEANTTPVICVAIALLVLAWLERSLFLGAVALTVGVVAGLSGLYIVDNLFDSLPHCGADLAGIGGFMVACGAAAASVEWARKPR